MTRPPAGPIKGRGATFDPAPRYQALTCEPVDDGWPDPDQPPPLHTTLDIDHARSVLTYNQSPDVPFDRSINPYRGCEHGCIYCYARPTHAWLGHSPGLEFETRLYWKPDAAAVLREDLGKTRYRCQPVALGVNTDAWQPVERRLRATREILRTLLEHHHPVLIVTKSALIERDVDLCSALARERLVSVIFSFTTLDHALARRLEPRAPTPRRRLQALQHLRAADIPVGVLVAPVIPGLTDAELEHILGAASEAGAGHARYILLRLPLEVKPLFEQWLAAHYPDRAKRVLSMIRHSRGGRSNDAGFGTRMRGSGDYADLLQQRFELACRKFQLQTDGPVLDCSRFQVPVAPGDQLSLF